MQKIDTLESLLSVFDNEVPEKYLNLTKFIDLDVKKYLDDKLDERFKYNILCDNGTKGYKENRAMVYSLCKNDCKFFLNNFVWIMNARSETAEDKDVMFLLYPYQEYAVDEIVKAITEGYDIPIEKSRDMGLSWLLIGIFVWGWHFHAWDLLVGSQKFENVDTVGNIKSLIEKARFIIERMPSWMRPKMKYRVHDKNGVLIHPTNNATLAGESNNTNFGRSDRRKAILFDEFSSWVLSDKAAWQSCSSTTKCRIPLSTPNTRGTNCHFYTILNNAKKKGLPHLTLHWSLNPVFNVGLYIDENNKLRSPWYDNEVNRATDIAEVYQELDIDFEASMGSLVYPGFRVDEQVSDDIEYNPDLPLYLGWDFGLDSTALVWVQPDPISGFINIIDEYQNDGNTREGADIMHYVNVVNSKPYKKAIHFGDPFSGENRSLAARGQSNASILRRNGIIFKSKRTKITTRISAARNIIKKLRVSSNCPIFIECLTSWQMVLPKSGAKLGLVPKHDEFSHMGEAFSYYAFNKRVSELAYRVTKKIEYSPTPSGVMI